MASCFLNTVSEDSVKGIYDVVSENAEISKHAGGIGTDISQVRAKGSKVRGTNGVSNGVIPYYLHQLDRIEQAAHFEVPIEKGKRLIATLRKELPGYAIPTYVQEVPYNTSKTPISS